MMAFVSYWWCLMMWLVGMVDLVSFAGGWFFK